MGPISSFGGAFQEVTYPVHLVMQLPAAARGGAKLIGSTVTGTQLGWSAARAMMPLATPSMSSTGKFPPRPPYRARSNAFPGNTYSRGWHPTT